MLALRTGAGSPGGDPPLELGGGQSCPHLDLDQYWFQVSGPQSQGKIYSCCSKVPVCGHLLQRHRKPAGHIKKAVCPSRKDQSVCREGRRVDCSLFEMSSLLPPCSPQMKKRPN